MFPCQYCQKILHSQGALNYHYSSKNCRKPDRTCPFCGYVFSCKRQCQTHVERKTCQKHETKNVISKPKLTLKSTLLTKYEGISREELISELETTKTQYQTLRDNPQNVNVQHNQIVVFPSAFGQEDMQLINDKLGDILTPLLKTGGAYIPNLTDQIHNSKKIPEYHNVYAQSERSKYVLVSDGTSFKYRPKKTIIDQIIEDKRSLISLYLEEHADQFDDRVFDKFEAYQNRLEVDPEFREELELEIGSFLLNMKSVIANDEKTRLLLEKVEAGEFDLPEVDTASATSTS